MSENYLSQMQEKQNRLQDERTKQALFQKQLDLEKQEHNRLDQQFSEESKQRRVLDKQKEIDSLYQDHNSLFLKSREIDITGRARVEEELKIGPGRGKSKVEKKAWYEEKNQALMQETKDIESKVSRQYRFLGLKEEAKYRVEQLKQMHGVSSGDYAQLLQEQLQKNGILDRLSELKKISLSDGNNKEALQSLCLLLERLLQPGAEKNGELLDRERKNWKKDEAFAGTISEEQLEKNQNIGTGAAWVFLMTNVANRLAKLVNSAPEGKVTPDIIVCVESMLYQTNIICNGLYCSDEYGKALIGAQYNKVLDAEKHLADSKTEVNTLEQEITILREKENKRQEEERKKQEEEKKRQEEERKRQEEEKKRQEEERKRQEEEKKRQEEERKRQEEEKKRQEEERKRQEEEKKRQEEERKRQEEEKKRQEEERIRENEARNRDNLKKIESVVEIQEIEHRFDGRLSAKLAALKLLMIREWDGKSDLIDLSYELWSRVEEQDVSAQRDVYKAKQLIKLQEYEMSKVEAKKEAGRKAAGNAASVDRIVRNSIAMGISPAMAGGVDYHLKVADNKKESIGRNAFRDELDKIDTLHPTLYGPLRSILAQIAVTDKEYQKFLGKKHLNTQGEDPYYAKLKELNEQIEQILFEKSGKNEIIGQVHQKRDELLYYLICQKGSENLLKISAAETESFVTTAISELALRNDKLDDFRKLGEEVQRYPLLQTLYRDAVNALSYLRFTSSGEEYQKLIKERTGHFKNALDAAGVFENLAGNRIKLQKGLLDYFGERIFSSEIIDLKVLENDTQKLLKDSDTTAFLMESVDLFESVDSQALKNEEIKAFDAKTQEGFRKYLDEHLSFQMHRNKVAGLGHDEIKLFAMVLAFPQFLGGEESIPGMEWVEDTQKAAQEALIYRLGLKQYVEGGGFKADVDYDKALETLTGYSLDISAKIKTDIFKQAMEFVDSCAVRKEQFSKKNKEKAEKSLPEYLKKKQEEVEIFRHAVTQEGILESKNKEAIQLWEEQKKKDFTRENIKEFLLSQAAKDGEEGIAAGYLALDDRELTLFYKAIEQRDCLDISKDNIGKNRFGMANRDYANELGRYELIDQYLDGKDIAVNYEKVVLGALSSRIDERRKKTTYRSRSTAVDWKLIARGLQLVNRCENEKKLFGSQKVLSTIGEAYQPDKELIQRNLHNAGTRTTRYLGRRIKGDILDNLKEQGENKAAKFVKYADKITTGLSLTEDGKNLVKAIVDFRNVSMAKKGSSSLRKEDAQKEKRLKASANEIKEAKKMNTSLVGDLSTKNARERSIDTMVESGVNIVGTIAGEINEAAEVPAKLLGEAAKLVNTFRSYIHETSNVLSFFEVSDKAGALYDLLKADKHFKDIKKPDSRMKQYRFVRDASGFEEMTEMSTVVGINMAHALLFSASDYNDTQSDMKMIAGVVLKSLGLKSLIGDISHEAAQDVFDAIMGEYR